VLRLRFESGTCRIQVRRITTHINGHTEETGSEYVLYETCSRPVPTGDCNTSYVTEPSGFELFSALWEAHTRSTSRTERSIETDLHLQTSLTNGVCRPFVDCFFPDRRQWVGTHCFVSRHPTNQPIQNIVSYRKHLSGKN